MPRARLQLSSEELSQLKAGSRVFLRYPDLPPWHDRPLAASVSSPTWVVITPTFDVHEENLLDNEVESVRCGPRGGVPRQIFGLPQFRFNQEELDEHWDHLSQEADALATKLRAALPPLSPPQLPGCMGVTYVPHSMSFIS